MGIGKLMALRLGKMGCKVTVVDINEENVQNTAKEIIDAGGKAFAIRTDVTSVEDVANAARECRRKFGDVTILINNAGIVHAGTLEKLPFEKAQ